MITTRKIQIYVAEQDATKKKELLHQLYEWRDYVRRAANAIVAHKYVQQNVRDFVYFTDEIQDKFYIKDCLKQGKGMSEQNTTYRICSAMMKGKVPSDVFSCLNQAVANTFKETLPDILKGNASVRSYKNNIPVPFSGKAISNIHWSEENKRFEFTLFKVPFACALGADRSNNQDVIERCVRGEYKICGSSYKIDDKKKKIFLLLCVDIPKKEYAPIKDKRLFAFLSVANPITYAVAIKAKQDYDSGIRVFNIGTAEEFNHRRREIQEAVRRCQVNNRYSRGGHGRKRKCKALDRWHEIENNYVDTKLHTYSRMLVDAAVKHQCSEIVLMRQTRREDKAKADNAEGDNYVLRNWTYYGLKDKIGYKAKQFGIAITEEK